MLVETTTTLADAETFLAVPVILAIIGVIAFAIWYSHKKEQERRQALADIASAIGWTFDFSRDSSHDDEYAHFEVFRKGHSRVAYNTLWGDAEINGRAHACKMGDFEYKITRHNGKSSTTETHRFSYLILHLPYVLVPDLFIRRENMFDKLAGFLGFDDIDFESAEFSRKFCVKSNDKRFAYDVITPRMMEFLLRDAPQVVDIEQGRLCLVSRMSRWQPDEFRAHLSWTIKFIDLWPDHVLRQMSGS